MNNNTRTYVKLRAHRRQMRLMGVGLSIVGAFMLFNEGPPLLDPEYTITCNGVVTTSYACKFIVLVWYLVLLVGGLLSLFSKKKWLNHTAIWEARVKNIIKGIINGS